MKTRKIDISMLNRVKGAQKAGVVVTLLLLLTSTLFAGEREYLTRVGVIKPFFTGTDSTLQQKSMDFITAKFHDMGGYDVYSDTRMKDAVEVFEKEYPAYCHEPRCAAVLGATLELDRMLYGSVVDNHGRFAVELTLVDVSSRQVINKSSLEGENGVSLQSVINGAMNKVHDIEDEKLSASLERYYGEEVDNKKAMYIAGGSWIAFGSMFALIANDQQESKMDYSDDLSGIDASMRSTPKSARAKGMGNCYVAASKDAYGAYYNPAGASWVKGPEAAVSYKNHFGEVNSMSAAFVAKATREIGWGHTFSYSGSPESYFQELDFGTIFSYKFNDLFGKLPPFSIGAALNIASTKTTGGSGSKYDQTGTEFGFGLDIGFLFELTRKIDLGLVFNNIPHVMVHNNTKGEQRSIETRPASFKMGATYEVGYATMLIAEGTFPLYEDQVFRLAGGVEQRLFSVMMLRLGAEKETLQSYDSPWHLTTGFGFVVPVKERRIFLDGAYDFNTSRELLGIWDVSLRIEI